jgi:hypothetical protein
MVAIGDKRSALAGAYTTYQAADPHPYHFAPLY